MSVSVTVPEGYKQTEIGVFPKDWEIKKFGDIFDFKSTASNSRSDLTETDEAHYIHYGDIHTIFHRHLDISKKSTPRIDLSLCKNATRIRNGDWVMADASEDFSGICKAIEISGIDEDKSVVAGLHTFLLRDRNEEYSPGFKGHLGEAKFLHDQYVRVSVGLKVYGVTKTSLRDLLIPVPPKTQQTKIEEILTQADAQIQSFEHLIAKKRDIKQGAMQELLTGKTRLPGFTGKWDVKSLGQVGEISGSGVDKKIIEGEIPVRLVNYLDVYNRSFIYSTELDHYVTAPPSKAIKCSVRKGDVFFTPTSEVRDDIAVSTVAMEDIPDGVHSYHVVRLRIRDDWDLNFRAYAFQTKSFLDQAAVLADGSGTRYVISLPNFRKLKVLVPSKLEQQAIGQILSDMDAEITALEERLEKAKAIKQGMMQQLLTGKIRLVD